MKRVFGIIILSFILAGCGASAEERSTQTALAATSTALSWTSTPTATQTSTSTPTTTPTKTPLPPTLTPTQFVLPMPVGEPLSEWKGFPVMPNAIAGQGDDKGYSFTISASTDEIQNFYESQLAMLGWDILGIGTGKDNVTAILIFMKGSETFSVTIIPQSDGIKYVILVN